MTKTIVVRTEFEAAHRWKDAPDGVAFLRWHHRHVFHVELELEVTHSDRELEFILVKRALTKFLLGSIPLVSDMSCEMIAEEVLKWSEKSYGRRKAICSVFEDGENGARVGT